MTYQRDPNDPLAERRAAVRGDDGSWGMFPAALGVIFLLLVGLIAYNMYTGDRGPNVSNPSATNTTTIPPATTVTPKAPEFTPPPAPVPDTPPAKAP